MKLAIMQPYFLAYPGYFQLIAAVDLFVVYDNIKYTKKGWINRNRFLLNGTDAVFSLPLRKGSDTQDIGERELAGDFNPRKLLNRFEAAYARAPYFAQTFPLLERIVLDEERNLFGFIYHSIIGVCRQLGISTEIRISSGISTDRRLKGQARVISLCRLLGADAYINAIGGVELYSADAFRACGIELGFLASAPFQYEQFGNAFVPNLSIIDLMMFNAPEAVQRRIRQGYTIRAGTGGDSEAAEVS